MNRIPDFTRMETVASIIELERMVSAMKTPPEETECDHDWKFVPDWEGDDTIPNGTRDCSHWYCHKGDTEQTDVPEGIDEGFDLNWGTPTHAPYNRRER